MENRKSEFATVRMQKEEVRRLYARLSRFYDAWGFIAESKATDRALKLAEIRDGEVILEVAVGTGTIFKRIVALNRSGRNEGIDLSPEMLAKAKKKLEDKLSNYSLRVADTYYLPYRDETFNLIINNYMFDLIPEGDFITILSEFRRVLKPGGRMVVTNMAPGKDWYSRVWDWLICINPRILAGCRPIVLSEYIKHSGFQNIHSEYIIQLTFPSMVVYAEKP